MFHRSSFKPASFSPQSWVEDGQAPATQQSFYAGSDAKSKRTRKSEEDEMFELAVALITSGVLECR